MASKIYTIAKLISVGSYAKPRLWTPELSFLKNFIKIAD